MSDEDGGGTLDGGDGEDTIVTGAGGDDVVAEPVIEMVEIAGHVADFEPGRDVIEVMFDPDLTPDPIVTVEDFDDGSGADILFEGQLILRVSGAQGLDPALIELHEVAPQAMPEMA
jgi:Ca2+-binding RTX toxin-like protein